MSHFIYPGANHKRFEHSLGVLELASRVFDIITKDENIFGDEVRKIIPFENIGYWRRAVRLAALCHDLGHLPFSHAGEKLLPEGKDHEDITCFPVT